MATSTPSRPVADQRGRLPAPTRDRRPALAALALLLVLAGALLSALVAYRSGDRVDVLVANRPLALGEEVQRGDFRTARVAAEGADYLESERAGAFFGTRTVAGIPEGTLLNARMFRVGSVVPPGAALVGVVLQVQQRPSAPLRSGDVVSVLSVSQETQVATPLLNAARVSDVRSADSGGGVSLSLLVPFAQVPTVAAAATSNAITVASLPANTPVDPDFLRE